MSQSYSILILGMFPSHQITHVGISESIGLNYSAVKLVIFEEFQPTWSWYLNITDGQTDRQTDRRHAIS